MTITELKDFCEKERSRIYDRHRFGISGREIVLEYTRLADNVIKRIYQNCLDHEILIENPQIAILALGGYGREDLNPYSDIDILIVYDEAKIKITTIEPFVSKLITNLWDLGFEVGNSCRSIRECVRVTEQDLFSKTSMIEARFVVGSRLVFQKFRKQTSKYIFKKKIENFIKQKITEWEDRHRAYGSTIYLQEPNIKESVGGLRDYHTAIWIAAARFSIRNLDEICQKGIVPENACQVCRDSIDFMLRLRTELHHVSKRKNDLLNFAVQENVAKNLGYADEAHALAEEIMMRDYYLHAEQIYEFAKLIIDLILHKTRSFVPFFERYFYKNFRDGFVIEQREICFQKTRCTFSDDATRLMKLFVHRQHNDEYRVSAEVRQQIAKSLDLIDDQFRSDPAIAEIFLSILRHPKNVAETLRRMHRWQVLDLYLPEFAKVRSLVRFDYYHQYTVDEHTLYAIENLEEKRLSEISDGENFIEIIRDLKKPELLRLAILLHDVGKGVEGEGGHDQKSVKMAKDVLDRLGIEGDDREMVLFLIDHHLVMSHTAQQRDLDDPKVIHNFAELVGNEDRLKKLYLLTFADIRAVSPATWNGWNAILLHGLYMRTLKLLRGTITETEIEEIKKEVRNEIGSGISADKIDKHFDLMPKSMLRGKTPKLIAKQIRLIDKLGDSPITTECFEEGDNYTQIGVCTRDEFGIFRKVVGAFAAKHINVISAEVDTRTDGFAISILIVNDATPSAKKDLAVFPVKDQQRRDLHETLLAVWNGEVEIEDLLNQQKPQTRSMIRTQPSVDRPMISFNNDDSDRATIIDIQAKDRLGLLYMISKTFFELEINLLLAKITTTAMIAVDSFYVTNFDGSKIIDGVRIEEIRQRLEQRLSGNEPLVF